MSKIDKLPKDAMNLSVIHEKNSTALHFTSESNPHKSCVYQYYGLWDIDKTTKDEQFLYVHLTDKNHKINELMDELGI